MQMVHQSSSSAMVLLMLIAGGTLTDCLNLRSGISSQPPGFQKASSVLQFEAEPEKENGDANYEVIEKKSIDRKGTLDCLCEVGSFWHWRIKDCVKQGAWAYECGFFPSEHHGMVCIDGLKCEALNTTIDYSGHPGAKPASCQHCEKEDQCMTGQKRHDKSCLKEYLLSGSACQTVRVTTTATASAKVTETVSKSSVASASAAATATASATEKAHATEEATAEGKFSADGKETKKEATVSATKEATASATREATAKAKTTVEAKASGKASAEAKTTAKGSAEGKACITVDEVKEHLKLINVPRLNAVLSAKVVSTGDQLAFDKAYELALAAARKAGLLNAKDGAKALASAEAHEHAGQEAEAKADEAAAWKAEEGANKAAQDKAKAEALAKAREAAAAEAAAAAKAAAEAAAKAEAAKKAAANAKNSAEAQAKADAAAAAQAAAEAASAAAADAKAKQEALADYFNQEPTEAPVRPTTPTTTNAPRKITAEQIAAKLP